LRSSVFYTLSSPGWLGSHSVPAAPDGCGIPSNAERNCASSLLPRRSANGAMRCKPMTLKGLCHRRILAQSLPYGDSAIREPGGGQLGGRPRALSREARGADEALSEGDDSQLPR